MSDIYDYIIVGAGPAGCEPALRRPNLRLMTGALPSGNTNAPAMALGWRASELILADGRAGA
jgi:choline dehydrogenase-like flavoprotein